MPVDPLVILNESLLRAMRTAAGGSLPNGASVMLAPSKNPQFGDFQCNAAMALGKSVGKPPRDIAGAMVEALNSDAAFASIAEAPEIAGPGFINIRLKAPALGAALSFMDTPALGIEPPPKIETVVADLCGVNLAKEMHVGHLRATVIGDTLARLHERLGHNVIRQNHFGDWGLPIAMVTDRIKHLAEAGKIDLNALSLAELEKHYKAAQRDAESDEKGLAAAKRFGLGPKAIAELEAQVSGANEARAAAKAALVALQRHDPAYVAVWKKISDVTLGACFENCRRLGVNVIDNPGTNPPIPVTAGESTYAEELAPLVDDLAKRGVAVEDAGALIIKLDDVGISTPLLVRKSDGGFLYATTDLAGIRRRVQKFGASKVVYAIDARQSLQLKQVFAGSHKAGYDRLPDGSSATLIHAAFGTVLGDDGRPFKTRSGENVKLTDLLDEAVARAEKAVAEKNPELPVGERRMVAEAVGIGAIKYMDLSSDRIKDYVFSFDRMLAFEGNTGPYLQYALVRVRSIFRKAKEQFGIDESLFSSRQAPAFAIAAPEEKRIALELLKYPGVIRASAEACEPHRLCTYLYDLAGAFSSFFAACPVLQAPDEATRLARLRLCALTGRVLADGLNCLGITALERM